MGYHVTTETKSRRALEKVKKDPQHFDLLVTDQTMPYLTGKELAQEISKINPDLPVILCTGYSSKITPEDAAKIGIRALLSKPLEMPKLLRVVRDVLDETRSNSRVLE